MLLFNMTFAIVEHEIIVMMRENYLRKGIKVRILK